MTIRIALNMLLTTHLGPCAHGNVRLVAGLREYEGRMEICYSGEWKMVCADGVNDTVAEVVCRQLNFSRHGKCRTDKAAATHARALFIDIPITLC